MPAEQAAEIRNGVLKVLGVTQDDLHKLKDIPAEQILAAGETVKTQRCCHGFVVPARTGWSDASAVST